MFGLLSISCLLPCSRCFGHCTFWPYSGEICWNFEQNPLFMKVDCSNSNPHLWRKQRVQFKISPEGWNVQQPEHCECGNKDEDNSPNDVNSLFHAWTQSSDQKSITLLQIVIFFLYYSIYHYPLFSILLKSYDINIQSFFNVSLITGFMFSLYSNTLRYECTDIQVFWDTTWSLANFLPWDTNKFQLSICSTRVHLCSWRISVVLCLCCCYFAKFL